LTPLFSATETNLRVIVIHDAVRPVVPSELVEQLVQAADEAGAAGVVCPLVSTVLAVGEDEQLEEALDRRNHVASETPQAFQTDVLKAAYSMVCDFLHFTNFVITGKCIAVL